MRRAAVARYAAMEIVRRLIGVAQLPIAPTRGWRARCCHAPARLRCRGACAAVGSGMTAALEGKRCIVTGANAGIGLEIATALAREART